MITVPIDALKEGMILEEDLVHNAAVVVPKHTIIKSSHLSQLKKFNFSDVLIRDVEGDQKIQAKLDQAPKAVLGLQRKFYRQQEFICIQGEPSEEIFILVEGELDVVFTDPKLFNGQMDLVDKIPIIEKEGKKISSIKGNMVNFGELGALLAEKRTATIVVAKDAVIASIPAVGDSFNRTIMRNARLGLNISITLAKRLKDINVYIAKYNNILSQVDHMVREFSTIYVTVTGKILKQVVASQDASLRSIHEECKKSPLYSRLLKFKQQTIDSSSMNSNETHFGENESLFSEGNLIVKEAGELVCYKGEIGKKMYMLMAGKLGVFIGDKMVACYEGKGEVIGEISVLLGYASKGRGFDRRTATVKAISKSRLVCVDADELDDLVGSNPSLVLHITKKLADRLKCCNSVFISAQRDAEQYMDKLSRNPGSCGSEIARILELFADNVNLIQLCSSEVKVLKKMHEAIESKYEILSEQLGTLSV